MLLILILSLSAIFHLALCNPINTPKGPSRWTIAINPFNVTSPPNTNFHLDFQYSPPVPRAQPVSQWGAHNTIAGAISAAREHDPDERVPQPGFRVKRNNVWLHTYPLFVGFTWGLLDFTVRQVEAELETTGYFACRWELSRVEDGKLGRIYARGDMWPNVDSQSKQM